jgi:hypothetical protein
VTAMPMPGGRTAALEEVRSRTHLGRGPRLRAAAAAALLAVVYVAPLWSIRLVAPQYPE